MVYNNKICREESGNKARVVPLSLLQVAAVDWAGIGAVWLFVGYRHDWQCN